VYGSWASFNHPGEPVDSSWERNKNQILQAEALGFDTTLIAQHLMNPRAQGSQYDQLDAWSSAAALAALTSRIEIIAAIKPLLGHPVVVAKQALQIEEISGGRFAINLVNAWYKPEIERAGIQFPEHDERYVYGREWLQVVKELLSGKPTTFHGKYFDIDNYLLRPAPAAKNRERPAIYLGGESAPARDLVTDLGDLWFINGQPRDRVAELIADVRRRPRTGSPVRFGLAAFVIARETDAQAQDVLAYQWELANADRADHEGLIHNADPKAEMFRTFEKYPHIGTNGGTAAGLVGSYDTVAQRIREFNELGIDTLMLQFQPFEQEQERFATEVIPRFRRLAG
jgi:alkanesulfonate monooxygenase